MHFIYCSLCHQLLNIYILYMHHFISLNYTKYTVSLLVFGNTVSKKPFEFQKFEMIETLQD